LNPVDPARPFASKSNIGYADDFSASKRHHGQLPQHMKNKLGILAVIPLVFVLALAQNLAAQQVGGKPAAAPAAASDASAWIHIKQVRLTARDRLVDVRYQVVDPKGVALLHGDNLEPLLKDKVTGQTVALLSNAKTGSLRNMDIHANPARTYVLMFSNPDQVIHSGSVVDLVLGTMTIKGLEVE
jgi:hypothetical protein